MIRHFAAQCRSGAMLLVAVWPVVGMATAEPQLPEIVPLSFGDDGLSLRLSGSAQGALSVAFQPDARGLTSNQVSGSATLHADIVRADDTGLVLALKSAFELYHDRLASDNYGGDLVQKVYGQAQTGLGSLEVGMADGAAYQLAVCGPEVDPEAGLDNPNATFFRDPAGRSAGAAFTLGSAVEPTLNYAKFSYYTPKLFGVQIGVSYTPSAAKYVLPFADTAPRTANRQTSFWETALRYEDVVGPVSFVFSGAAAFAHADAATKTAGHAGLTDWALGLQASYPVDDTTTFSLGGAYRRANSYAFDIENVLSEGRTHSAHLSAKIERGDWSFGGEYGDGAADGNAALPGLGSRGYQTALGYKLNANWLATVGWQHLRYTRSAGTFYNRADDLNLDALFLHLHFEVTEAGL